MKISRMSGENMLPTWAVENIDNETKAVEEQQIQLREAANQMPEELDENSLIIEREKIESHASNNSTYHYSSKWPAEIVSSLKEYASVCGADIKAIDINLCKVQKSASSSQLIKTASVADTGLKLRDPFGLDSLENKSSESKDSWQTVVAEKKLAAKPSMMSNSVRSIGGGEDYFTNSNTPLAKNQNSIVNPNAIKDFAESKEEGNGEKIARNIQERKESKKQEVVGRDADSANKLRLDTLMRGSVFPTGVHTLEAGSASKGVTLDKSHLPSETTGEKIASVNNQKKADSQKERGQFNISKEAKIGIGDSLFNSLKKTMGK